MATQKVRTSIPFVFDRSFPAQSVVDYARTVEASGVVDDLYFWDQLTSFLRTSGLTVIALALVIAFAAWVVGPSSAATNLRGWWHRTLGTSSASGADATTPGPVARFVARSKPLLRGIGMAIAFVVLIAWNHPTVLTVLVIGLVLVVYLVILELLGRNATNEPAADTTAI